MEALPWPVIPPRGGYGEASTAAAAFVRAVAECDGPALVVCAHDEIGACAIALTPG